MAERPDQRIVRKRKPPARTTDQQGDRPQREARQRIGREGRRGGHRTAPRRRRPRTRWRSSGKADAGRGGRTAARRWTGGDRGDDRRGGDRGRFEGPPEIDIEKLISDPLYLDNQAHGVVSRMRDMDSGTKSQLRRLYNAVRRAVRAPENERQQQFVMLRARLAYTIARHSLRSLDSLEKLLLQVTRKNDARGYERFRDLFEAIVAYNE